MLTVVSGSPAAAAKLQAFDDVIVGAGAATDTAFNVYLNAAQITQEKGLAAVIGRSEEKQLRLRVHNCRTGKQREITLTPKRGWSNNEGGLVGIKIRYDPLDRTLVQLAV